MLWRTIYLTVVSTCKLPHSVAALGYVHNETAEHPELKTMFKDTKAFEQLRIEPHYEYVTNSFPDLKKSLCTDQTP